MTQISRRSLALAVAPLMLIGVLSHPASAQTCLGSVPMADRHDVHIGGTLTGARSPEPGVGLAGQASVGYRRAFGGGSIYRINLPNVHYDIEGLNFFGGWRIKVGKIKAEICPIFTYDRSAAEVRIQYVAGDLLTSFSFLEVSESKSIEVAIGRPVWQNGTVALVPTAAFGMAWGHSVPVGFIDAQGRPVRQTTFASYFRAGVGVVVDNRIAFTPAISRPLLVPKGYEGGTTLSLTMDLSLHK